MSDWNERESEALEAVFALTAEADRDTRIYEWIISAIVALLIIDVLAFIFLREAWPWFVPTPIIVLPISVVAIFAVAVAFMRRGKQRLIDMTRRGAPLGRRPSDDWR